MAVKELCQRDGGIRFYNAFPPVNMKICPDEKGQIFSYVQQ